MKKEEIVLWGINTFSKLVEYYINKDNAFKITAYVMDKNYINKTIHNNKPLVSFEDLRSIYPPNKYRLLFPISYKQLNEIRENRFLEAKKMGYSFANYISKDAICDSKITGENIFIMPFARIQPFVEIENNVFIMGGDISHDSIIKKNTYMANATLAGNVTIGNNCFVGVGCTILDNINIGDYSILGAGTTISRNVKNNSIIIANNNKKLPLSSKSIKDSIFN